MEYINILEWIYSQPAFNQTILASAFFLVTTALGQFLLKKIKKAGSQFTEAMSKIDVVKHIVHREYVNSSDFQTASYGASVVMLQAMRWILRGFLILIFFFGVSSLINGNWWYALGAWFVLNSFTMAYDWIKDQSDKDKISHVSDEIKEEIFNQFGVQREIDDQKHLKN